MNQLILISASPRRRDLLQEAGYFFSVHPVKVSEIIENNLNPQQEAEKWAQHKGEVYLKLHKPLKGQGFLLLSADTVVAFKGKTYGKPQSEVEATHLLSALSGNMHSVITALFIQDIDQEVKVLRTCESQIWFRDLSEQEIHDYVATGEPFDKAGGYGIQGLAHSFVTQWQGSYSNIVGLPMELLEELEKQYEWQIRF